MHSIYTIENASNDTESITNDTVADYRIADVGNIVTQDPSTVNTQKSEVKKSFRGMREEFADKTLKSFGITKLNDSIHIQRQVLSTLETEGFFTNAQTRSRTDVNEES